MEVPQKLQAQIICGPLFCALPGLPAWTWFCRVQSMARLNLSYGFWYTSAFPGDLHFTGSKVFRTQKWIVFAAVFANNLSDSCSFHGGEFYLWSIHLERKKVLTDAEYDILDELYFVTPYETLRVETGYDEGDLKSNLIRLVEEGLVKVYLSMDEEAEDSVDMEKLFRSYYYLASKKGLFAHNSK